MFDCPRPVLDYWHTAFEGTLAETRGNFILSVVSTLDRKRPAMMLERADGSIRAAITPELASAIHLDASMATAAALRERLKEQGIAFHDPDYLFYLPANGGLVAGNRAFARQLTEEDRAAFDTFHATASEQDREDAFVEFAHWAVFGCFDGGRLVSAASAILWHHSPMADLGILTLPDSRGKGYASAAVRSIAGFARQQGYEPQYRCQMNNQASIGLAKACGLALFGTWVVAAEA
ncbi:GNAT superfamily N-acetyltransferase [Sphingomonas trueperi]|uniref:GNAT family N-acetyltransferase n=1 Tax=Sphingomonas trueperi TaxID=53317 RepID=UPI003397EC38